MKIKSVLEALIPYYGSGARFRLYLRLRELYRKKRMTFLAKCLKSKLQYKYGCELAIGAQISPKASFMHTVGVVIGEGCIVESGVVIYSGVVLGRKDINKEEYPIIEEGVILCTGASVLGNVRVKKNAIIGAHAVVLRDCEEHGIYIGSPAIKKCEK